MKVKKHADPKYIVYVVAVCSVKIYSTNSPDEAKTRATEIVRESLRTQDNHVWIPRAMVQSANATLEDVADMLKSSGLTAEEE